MEKLMVPDNWSICGNRRAFVRIPVLSKLVLLPGPLHELVSPLLCELRCVEVAILPNAGDVGNEHEMIPVIQRAD
jgi:hypothetical protein